MSGSASSGGRPLRICHLGKFYPPASGGIETHVQALARAQVDLGCEVEVLCVNHADAHGRDVTHDARARTRTVVDVDRGVRVTRMGRLGTVARLELVPQAPLEVARRREVDILHLHSPNPSLLFALLAAGRLPPLVITHHSDVVRQKVLGAAFAPFENVAYGRAALLLSDSEGYIGGSTLLTRYREKVHALPLGIDLSPYLEPSAGARAAAETWRAELGGPLWVTVGRLVYYKGLEVALEALRHAPGRLLVIGDGPLAEPLRRRADLLGVRERVIFAGHLEQDQLVGALLAATGLWFPSVARAEGYGLAQVEALAAGCPVINTAVPDSGVSWVSRDGETGLTVPVGDAQALAAAATRLVEDAPLRERFAQSARARARLEFDWMRMGERSLALYRLALSSHRQRAELGLGGVAG